MGNIDQSVSPGIGGFLAFFLLACALWLLMRNMLKHMRTLTYREELRERATREDLDGSGGLREPPADPTAAGAAGPAAVAPGLGDPSDGVVTRPSSLSKSYPREPQA